MHIASGYDIKGGGFFRNSLRPFKMKINERLRDTKSQHSVWPCLKLNSDVKTSKLFEIHVASVMLLVGYTGLITRTSVATGSYLCLYM